VKLKMMHLLVCFPDQRRLEDIGKGPGVFCFVINQLSASSRFPSAVLNEGEMHDCIGYSCRVKKEIFLA